MLLTIIIFIISAIPDNLKKVASEGKPIVEISVDGDTWTIKTTVSDRVKDTTFKLGEDFETVSLTSETVKVQSHFFIPKSCATGDHSFNHGCFPI